MGLFSKPSEDKIVEMFNGLSDTEKESVKNKLFGVVADAEPKNEPEQGASDVAETTEQNAEPNGNADNGNTNGQPKEEPKETFEDMYKRLVDETKKELDAMKAELNQKFEEIAKAKEEKNAEKKPFGLAEAPKEHSANAKPKETSRDMINRLFGGNR